VFKTIHFLGGRKMTRKRIASVLLALCMLVSLSVSVLAADFDDIDNSYAKEEIEYLADKGVVDGDENGNFNPEDTMTRGEAAQLFANLLKLSVEGDISGFTDVAGHWAASAIAKCYAAGIMQGNGDGTMDPDGVFTREMFFVMFVRALGIPEETEIDKDFADEGEISDWAVGAVAALVNRGYINGATDTTLEPETEASREMIAKLLGSVLDIVVEDGAKVEADGKKIVLVVADNVTVTAPAGTLVFVAAVADDTVINGQTITAEDEIVPAPAPAASATDDGPSVPTVPDEPPAAVTEYDVVLITPYGVEYTLGSVSAETAADVTDGQLDVTIGGNLMTVDAVKGTDTITITCGTFDGDKAVWNAIHGLVTKAEATNEATSAVITRGATDWDNFSVVIKAGSVLHTDNYDITLNADVTIAVTSPDLSAYVEAGALKVSALAADYPALADLAGALIGQSTVTVTKDLILPVLSELNGQTAAVTVTY